MRRWVPRPVDVATAAGLTVVTQVELWAVLDAGLPRAALAATYAVGTAAIAWHRIAPLTALTVALTGLAVVPGALAVDPSASLGWFVAAFTVMASAGYHARRPVVALAVALGSLALSIVLQKGWLPGDIAYAWFLSGAAWLAGRAVAVRTLRAELSEQRAAHAEQEARWRAAAAVADERLRIARELHDVVSHGMTVVTLHVSGVRRLLRPEQAEERAALEAAERAGREAQAEMHRMLGVLRGPGAAEAEPADGLARLPELLDRARAGGLRTELTVTGDVRLLPAGVELAAYRIVQEAVTNVLRHAGAQRLDCTVAYRQECLELHVRDDGRGSAEPGAGGQGLVGMRERAALYGGSVEAGAQPSGGFAVHAVLPVPGPAPERTPTPVPVREAP